MGEYETADVREQRFQALVQQIRALDPDIVGVQEANKLPDYAERLGADLGYDFFYHVGVGGVRLGKVGLPWNLREGDVILTKRDLQGSFAGRKQLSGGHVGSFFTFHFSDATQIMAVRIMNRGQPLFVFVTHWHASILATPEMQQFADSLRANQLVTLSAYDSAFAEIKLGESWRLGESRGTLDFIRETAGKHPFILMGDFNAPRLSPEIQNLLRSGMVDVFYAVHSDSLSGYTWDPDRNRNFQTHYLPQHQAAEEQGLSFYQELKQMHEATPKRIDFIFWGDKRTLEAGEVAITESHVVLDEVVNGLHASDHFGVYAEFVFSK